MKKQQWITDRLPTQEESGNGAWIRVPHDDSTGWKSRHCDHLKPGEPWAPWPKMPPFEPEPEYWSRPSDVPAEARWFIEDDGDCYMIQIVTIWGLILARDIRITWEELSGWRWSDRPFDRFKDGNPCTKKCSGEN